MSVTQTTEAALIAAIAASAANINQIDLASKPPCRVATTANITLSGTQTIDGVAVVAGNRVLVKSQTLGATNGIYVCAVSTWARAEDFATSAQVKAGVFIPVSEGTLYANSVFQLTTSGTIVLDTTELVFALPKRDGYYLVDAGAADAISVTVPTVPALTAWTDLIGIRLAIKVIAANTTAVTLAVTGLTGTKQVKKQVSSALIANDLLANGIYEFVTYDGTTFQVTTGLKGENGNSGDGTIKKYVAWLTQMGTAAPTAAVMLNTFGAAIVWTRIDVGLYTGTLTGVFIDSKTNIIIGRAYNVDDGGGVIVDVNYDNNAVYLISSADWGSADTNGRAMITIEIYP